MPALATQRRTAIARPLKVLVPLIQQELKDAERAGQEHYRHAGEMLIEAKDQVGHGNWGKWLGKNFALSQQTAASYMRFASIAPQNESPFQSYSEAVGYNKSRRKIKEAYKEIFKDAPDVESLAEARQSIKTEIELHRELAVQLIDLGFRAMATRLHPDKGGTREAMTRLNRVRDELKSIASTRRFI